MNHLRPKKCFSFNFLFGKASLRWLSFLWNKVWHMYKTVNWIINVRLIIFVRYDRSHLIFLRQSSLLEQSRTTDNSFKPLIMSCATVGLYMCTAAHSSLDPKPSKCSFAPAPATSTQRTDTAWKTCFGRLLQTMWHRIHTENQCTCLRRRELQEKRELIAEVSCHMLAAGKKGSGLYIRRMTPWQRGETLQKMCWQPNNQSARQT